MNSLIPNIISLIPQRPPFVFVDALLSSDAVKTKSSFKVPSDSFFVENGQLQAAALVENIAQTAAARAGYTAFCSNEPVRVGYIGAIKNLEILRLPTINDQLITEITIENQIFDVSLIFGQVWCNEQLIAQCNMKIFIQNP